MADNMARKQSWKTDEECHEGSESRSASDRSTVHETFEQGPELFETGHSPAREQQLKLAQAVLNSFSDKPKSEEFSPMRWKQIGLAAMIAAFAWLMIFSIGGLVI